ncbi:MAG TPA: anti-sigma factor antagonist [Mycobacteriales bacterium]|nr:anti-sigma factor antagonist [Mycobacteriales bacterium]
MDVRDTRVTVSGRLDTASIRALRLVLMAMLEDDSTGPITVDLDDVDFVDGAAFRVLLRTSRELRRNGGNLVIACSDPDVVRLCTITGLDSASDLLG